jgi:hypothetical protein
MGGCSSKNNDIQKKHVTQVEHRSTIAQVMPEPIQNIQNSEHTKRIYYYPKQIRNQQVIPIKTTVSTSSLMRHSIPTSYDNNQKNDELV